jgi:hypothetical protein
MKTSDEDDALADCDPFSRIHVDGSGAPRLGGRSG